MAEVTSRPHNVASTYDTSCTRDMGIYFEESGHIRDKYRDNATTSSSPQKCDGSDGVEGKVNGTNSSDSGGDDRQSISSDNPNRLSRALSELSDMLQPEVEILVTPVDETAPVISRDALPASRPTSLHVELDTSDINNSLAASIRSISELSDIVEKTKNENYQQFRELAVQHGSLDRDHNCVLRDRTHAQCADDYQSKRHSDGAAYNFTVMSPMTPTAKTSPRSSNGSLSHSNRGVVGYSTCLSQETLRDHPRTCEDRRLLEMETNQKSDSEMIDDLLRDLLSAGENSTHTTIVTDQQYMTNGFDKRVEHRKCEFSRKTPRTHFVPRSRSEEFVRRSDSVSSCTMCGYTDHLAQLKTSTEHRDDDTIDGRHRTPPIPTDDVNSAVACLSDTIASGCDSETLEQVVIATMKHNMSRQALHNTCCHDDSPERVLDDVLETMETETYSGDVTLRRVFAVNEEYRRVKSKWSTDIGSYNKSYKSRMLHGSIKRDSQGEEVEGEYYTSTQFCRNMNRGTSPETMLDRALETIRDIDDNDTLNNTENETMARDNNHNFEQITSQLHNANFGDKYGPYTSSCECVADDKSTRSLDTDAEKYSSRDATPSEESDSEDRTVDDAQSDGAFHKLIGETLQMTERILSSFSHVSCESLDELECTVKHDEQSLAEPDESMHIVTNADSHTTAGVSERSGDIVTPDIKTSCTLLDSKNGKSSDVDKHAARTNSTDNFLDHLSAYGYDSGSDLNSDLCTMTDDEADLDVLVHHNSVVASSDLPLNHKQLTIDVTANASEPTDGKRRMEVARSPSPVQIVRTPPCITVNNNNQVKQIPHVTSETVYQFPVTQVPYSSQSDAIMDTAYPQSNEDNIVDSSPYKSVMDSVKQFDDIAQSLSDTTQRKTSPASIQNEPDSNRIVQIVDDASHKSVRYLFNSSTSKESKQHFERLCSGDANMLVPYNGKTRVKSEEVDVQKVTMLFSWPKSPGPPGVAQKPVVESKSTEQRKPFKTYRFRRVTRIRADGSKEIITGPVSDAIEYDISTNKTQDTVKKPDSAGNKVADDVKISLQFRRTKMKKNKMNTGNKAIELPTQTITKYRPTPPPKPNVNNVRTEQSPEVNTSGVCSQPVVVEASTGPIVTEVSNGSVVKKRGPKTLPKPDMTNWVKPVTTESSSIGVSNGLKHGSEFGDPHSAVDSRQMEADKFIENSDKGLIAERAVNDALSGVTVGSDNGVHESETRTLEAENIISPRSDESNRERVPEAAMDPARETIV